MIKIANTTIINMKTISNTNIFSLLLLCLAAAILFVLLLPLFFLKCEIIINVNNNNKTIKRDWIFLWKIF
jgi:hypothetical protein